MGIDDFNEKIDLLKNSNENECFVLFCSENSTPISQIFNKKEDQKKINLIGINRKKFFFFFEIFFHFFFFCKFLMPLGVILGKLLINISVISDTLDWIP